MSRHQQDKPAVIYAIRCSKTGRVYIGSTANLPQRAKAHFRELKYHNKRASALDVNGHVIGVTNDASIWQHDYDAYGEESFEVYILESDVAKENRKGRESYWIDLYKATDPKHGYNLKRERNDDVPNFVPGLPPCPK